MHSNTYGVDIHNKTGQNVLVEFLDVGSDGSTKVYSTATLAAKGTFTNRVPAQEQGYGKRVRFSLADRPPEDTGARLELKLSDDKARYYDLTLANGRLSAKEYAKGREPTQNAALTGGDGR
jgi:hypothetical protein